MIDPIRNQAYQEYNANKIPPKSSAAEAGTEKFSLDYSDEGVLYEPSEKEADSKADPAASKKQSGSFRQAALLELSSPIYKDIEERFQGFFGTKVKLDAGVKSGKIVIKYSSNEDLERILELIEK